MIYLSLTTIPERIDNFVNFYKNTYQHGGISLQEMFIPFSFFSPK